jgi:hypothetical protein
MRRLSGLALLVVPFLATPAWAGCTDWGTTLSIPAYRLDVGGKFWCKLYNPCCNGPCPQCGPPASCNGPQLGPWYNYWPLEAHFQVPAMPHYPYWPSPMTLPGGAAALGGYGGYGPANFHAPVAPAGYYPGYGYGH